MRSNLDAQLDVPDAFTCAFGGAAQKNLGNRQGRGEGGQATKMRGLCSYF